MAAILHQDRSARRCSVARPSITIERGTKQATSTTKEDERLGMQKSFLAMAIGLATAFQSGHALPGKNLDAATTRAPLIFGVAAGGLARFMTADRPGQWRSP